MTIIGALPFVLQNGTTADANQVDADFDQIVTDVNNNAAHNGANSDITSLTALTTPVAPAQGGTSTFVGGTTTGSANAQILASTIRAGFTLITGYRVWFFAGFTNTGPMTLNVNSTGAVPVVRQGPTSILALTGGEIVVNSYICVIYDGLQFELVNSAAAINTGLFQSLASASPDLGTITTHNAFITGSTTITSFGASANIAYPLYQIVFQTALTLTYNAVSLILPGLKDIPTAADDSCVAAYLGGGNWKVISYDKANGAPISTVQPTTQVKTSGSGTYTPTSANVRWIAVRLVGGGGGGGGGQNAAAATAGNSTTFSTFTAGAGAGGSLGACGTGGTASGGYSNSPGTAGGPPTPPGTSYNGFGGSGGSSQLGGGGAPSSGAATGSVGAANTGSGGGGGGATNGSLTGSGGAGGGSGGCVLGYLPATTYSYSVGAGGAGAAGSSSASSSGGAGGAGATGIIEITEHY